MLSLHAFVNSVVDNTLIQDLCFWRIIFAMVSFYMTVLRNVASFVVKDKWWLHQKILTHSNCTDKLSTVLFQELLSFFIWWCCSAMNLYVAEWTYIVFHGAATSLELWYHIVSFVQLEKKKSIECDLSKWKKCFYRLYFVWSLFYTVYLCFRANLEAFWLYQSCLFC